MKSTALLIPLLLPLPAFAGGSATPGQSIMPATSATATSASRSTATARVSGKVTSNVTINTSNDRGVPRAGSGNLRSGGRDRDNSSPAPVIAGSIATSNPCGIGGGLGGSGGGGGGFLQWLVEGERCSLREDSRLLWQMGEADSAMQTACNNAWIADGRARAGHPCERDMQRWRDQGYRYVLRSDGKWVWER